MKQVCVLILALFTIGSFNSCKKKTLPEPEPGNEPVFYFSGQVDGTPYTLEAGINDYYMYSDYIQNSATGVYGFKGLLQQSNCSSCKNSIEIEINDHRSSAIGGPSGIDSAFQSTFYPYCAGSWAPASYKVTYYPIFNNTPLNYLWNWGDGSTSTSMIGSHIYKHSGNYNVSLSITDNFSCTNTLSNWQTIGLSDNSCATTITVTSTSTLNATYSHSTIGVPPYNFLWNLGDGNFDTSSAPTHSYATQGRYPVSLRVIDAVNDTAYANVNYVTSGSNMCGTNYILLNDSAITNTNGVSNVIVKWTDSNGIVYTSNSNLQPTSSFFKILSATEYHENEKGQKTKRLRVRFKCMVYNGSSSLLIDNAEAVIVVAYK